MFHSLKPFLCIACVLCLSIPEVQAATWQVHKMAGFRAFDNEDYAGAVEKFEAALTIAYEEQVPAQDLGAILENLATAFLAAGQPRRAWEAMERWDKILAESPDEPWVPEQQPIRDDLASLILEALGETEPSRDLELAVAATTAPPGSGDYAIHLVSLENENKAQASWAQLKATYPSLLVNKALVVRQVDLGDQGIFYRILAASFVDSAVARKVCRELESLGQYCAVLPLE